MAGINLEIMLLDIAFIFSFIKYNILQLEPEAIPNLIKGEKDICQVIYDNNRAHYMVLFRSRADPSNIVTFDPLVPSISSIKETVSTELLLTHHEYCHRLQINDCHRLQNLLFNPLTPLPKTSILKRFKLPVAFHVSIQSLAQ